MWRTGGGSEEWIRRREGERKEYLGSLRLGCCIIRDGRSGRSVDVMSFVCVMDGFGGKMVYIYSNNKNNNNNRKENTDFVNHETTKVAKRPEGGGGEILTANSQVHHICSDCSMTIRSKG